MPRGACHLRQGGIKMCTTPYIILLTQYPSSTFYRVRALFYCTEKRLDCILGEFTLVLEASATHICVWRGRYEEWMRYQITQQSTMQNQEGQLKYNLQCFNVVWWLLFDGGVRQRCNIEFGGWYSTHGMVISLSICIYWCIFGTGEEIVCKQSAVPLDMCTTGENIRGEHGEWSSTHQKRMSWHLDDVNAGEILA